MKTAIIVDSVGYFPKEITSLPNVFQIDLMVNFYDGTTINDSSNEEDVKLFYKKLSNETQLPTTSQPQIGKYYELMNQIIEEGYDTVICIHLSSGISGTYQAAVVVTKEFSKKINVICIDTKGASIGMEAVAKLALDLIDQEADLNEIVEKLTWQSNNNQIYLMVEDLKNLVKGGRLSASSALLGGVLQIKPLLHFDKNGKIVLFEKIRTNKRVYKRWSELVNEAKKQYPKGIEIAFAHGDAYEEVKQVEQQILSAHPDLTSHITQLGPVVGTHTGKGAKGMAIIPKIENFQ